MENEKSLRWGPDLTAAFLKRNGGAMPIESPGFQGFHLKTYTESIIEQEIVELFVWHLSFRLFWHKQIRNWRSPH